MVLLLEPCGPALHWCALLAGQQRAGRLAPAATLGELARELGEQARGGRVAYVLPHGGPEFARSDQPVDEGTEAALARIVQLLPDENAVVLAAVRQGVRAFPLARHVILCETGFFASLPAAAAEYAIPEPLRQRGLRRYGSQGLAHDWVCRQVLRRLQPGASRLVSVVLGNQTTVTAVAGGRAVDTSAGFTAVEGIPSATSCGDIDPMIPLHLRASGMSLAEISQLLLRESGFAALVGRPCGLRELLAAGDGARAAAREAYAASVRKQIGASIAVLGGIDALAFCAAEPLACAGFVRETCAALGRLAVPWAGWEAGLAELPPQVHVLPFDRYEALAQLAAACP